MSAMLIAPFMYDHVEASLYRGSFPLTKNYKFLSLLELKTVVSLIPASVAPPAVSEFGNSNIQHKVFNIDHFASASDPVTVTYEDITQILEYIIDYNNHPLYIHCLDGRTVTGVIIFCLRRLQNWSFPSSLSEYQRFMTTTAIFPNVSNFVDSFRNLIQIPQRIPRWLWPTLFKDVSTPYIDITESMRSLRHPLLQLIWPKIEVSPKDINTIQQNLEPRLQKQSPSSSEKDIVDTLASQNLKIDIFDSTNLENVKPFTESMQNHTTTAISSTSTKPLHSSSPSKETTTSITPTTSLSDSPVNTSAGKNFLSEFILDTLSDTSQLDWFISNRHEIRFSDYISRFYGNSFDGTSLEKYAQPLHNLAGILIQNDDKLIEEYRLLNHSSSAIQALDLAGLTSNDFENLPNPRQDYSYHFLEYSKNAIPTSSDSEDDI